MPDYPYACEPCGLEEEIVKPMSEAGDTVLCPSCGKSMRRIWSASVQFSGTSVKDAEYYHAFGEVVKSDNHRKELMKKHNAVEVGSESAQSVRHHTERYRLEKLKKDYDE